MDTASLRGETRPTVIVLADGIFRKDGDAPIRADGELHPYPGDAYVDQRSISIKDARHVVEVDHIRGKLAYIVEYVVSADDDTLTWHIANYTSPNGQGVKSETVQRRVGTPAQGAHLLSGTWERVSVSVDSKSDWILTLDGDRFSWRMENGTGYDAVVGGKAVPIAGDNSGARAVVTRPKPDTIVETDYSATGTFDDVLTMQLLSDNNTIRCVARSRRQKKPTTFILHRQEDR